MQPYLPEKKYRAEESLRLIRYIQELIRKPSITPNDGDCIPWLAQRLQRLGFECQIFNLNGVTNLIAKYGEGKPAIGFVGHTDVVPAGDESRWLYPPFSAQMHQGFIYGRGAADMKSGLACWLVALEQFLQDNADFNGSLYFLVTSDEEGEAEYGTRAIVEHLKQQNVTLDACIVGEPTASRFTGDTIKVGRRGAISGKLTIEGKAGHVAYPHHIINPVHIMGEVISALNQIQWDQGSQDFPGTSLQITHVDSGDFVDNVSPHVCHIHFNIRYSHQWSEKSLNEVIVNTINPVADEYRISWDRPCFPYMTDANTQGSYLLPALEKSIFEVTGHHPALSTSGGTSDGRFVATLAGEVYEIGVPNQTIHQFNERVSIADLIALRDIYLQLLTKIF
ncbi:succinyl-diaminopimelate desuccinylase [Pleionea sp. CnH1-48]|nr:succinyl-diaminopimelate desuccinylase [Pleionea sp. CnH1-48]